MTYLLVVDVNISTSYRIKKLLSEFDVEVHQATTVHETINRMNAADPPYDLVVTDLNLGAEDGFDLLEKMHRLHTETLFVILTSMNTRYSFVEAIKRGAADYILKPYDLDYLKNKLAEHILAAEAAKRLPETSPKQLESAIYTAVKKAIREHYEMCIGLVVFTHKDRAVYTDTDAKDAKVLRVFLTKIEAYLHEGDEVFERGSNALVLVMPKRAFAFKEEAEQALDTFSSNFIQELGLKNTLITNALISLPNEVDPNQNALTILAERVEEKMANAGL